MPTKTKTTDAPPLVDETLVPELYEGVWIARKNFPACFEGRDAVKQGDRLTSEFSHLSRTGAVYLLKNAKQETVQYGTATVLQDLCRRPKEIVE